MGAILDGIVVLDVASYIAAPVATTLMADYGASVIKVEPPAGDAYRHLGANPGMPVNAGDYQWQVANRNKRGVALDLRNEAGRRALDRLVETADVFVTNFPAPTRRKLRLHYEDLAPLNPGLVYASLSAYGERGPEADSPGFDSTAYWARSGLMHFVRPDPEGPPGRSAPGQGDHPTGVSLFGAIMLALYERMRSGKGCHVHTSLLANGLWGNAFNAQAVLHGGEVPLRARREAMANALTNHYCCRDGRWFILTILNQARDWPRLLEATGMSELAADERFADQARRNENAHALIRILDGVFAARDLAYWKECLTRAGLTIGVVGSHDDVTSDEQMAAAGAVRAVDDPRSFGAERAVDTPLWIEGQSKAPMTAAPRVGEHNQEVLLEAGFSEADLEALRRAGAFGERNR